MKFDTKMCQQLPLNGSQKGLKRYQKMMQKMLQKSITKNTKKIFEIVAKMVPGGAQNRAPALPRGPSGHQDPSGIPGTSFWQLRTSLGLHLGSPGAPRDTILLKFLIEFSIQ